MRLLAILLMLIVPFQFGWSAVLSIHGHTRSDVVVGFHTHDGHHGSHGDHQHPHPGKTASDEPNGGIEQAAQIPAASGAAGQNDVDRVDGHYHPILASLVMHSALPLDCAPSSGAPSRPPDSFSSRIPPLFDWPPSAHV